MKEFYKDNNYTIYQGNSLDVLKVLPDKFIQCCVTSPPYWGLRNYNVDGQLGLEKTPEEYIKNLVEVFKEVKRVLRDNGTLWLNLGDSYYNYRPGGVSQTKQTLAKNEGAVVNETSKRNTHICGLKEKDLVGIPWAVAFALRADGWYLRSDIIWHKKNPLPESVKDRPTKSHEYLFLLSKNKKYYYDANAIKEKSITFENREDGITRNRKYKYNSKENNNPEAYRKNIKGNMSEKGVTRTTEGLNLKTQEEKTKETRNKRSVWTIATHPFKGAHFATFPLELIIPPIKAGSAENDIILDPFMGSGTVLEGAYKLNRKGIGIELNEDYCNIALKRLKPTLGLDRLF